MISAEPYSGKTLLTLAIALALDSGSPLFNHFHIRERKKVFYLGQDAPSWDYAEQIRKLINGYGMKPEDLQRLDIDMMLNEGVNLFEPKSLRMLQDWYEHAHFNVLFIDTLAAFHSGDENSTRDMGILFAMLKSIRDRFKCAVIFTHHTAKPSQGVVRSENYAARGNSVIAGSIDFHLSLKREADNRIRLSIPKGRGAELLQKLSHFDIIEEFTANGPSVRLVMPDPGDTKTGQIIKALSTPQTRAQLIALLQLPPAAIDNGLTALARAGQVRKVGRGTWEKT